MLSKLFVKCLHCNTTHFIAFLRHAHYVCSKCGYHFRIEAPNRIKKICDRGTFFELDEDLQSADPLHFPQYAQKTAAAMAATSLSEAVITGIGKINDHRTALAVFEPRFMMASMGSVVGEKITRLVEYATDHTLPAVFIVCSGGARMQEGIYSLMQMAKTAAAIKRHHDRRLLLVTVLADPTTGGVTASFAMLGDIIIGETKALIGFAGPRVIQQTIGQVLPPGFQTAEFLLEHGMLDLVVPRKNLKSVLANILRIHEKRPYDQGGENHV